MIVRFFYSWDDLQFKCTCYKVSRLNRAHSPVSFAQGRETVLKFFAGSSLKVDPFPECTVVCGLRQKLPFITYWWESKFCTFSLLLAAQVNSKQTVEHKTPRWKLWVADIQKVSHRNHLISSGACEENCCQTVHPQRWVWIFAVNIRTLQLACLLIARRCQREIYYCFRAIVANVNARSLKASSDKKKSSSVNKRQLAILTTNYMTVFIVAPMNMPYRISEVLPPGCRCGLLVTITSSLIYIH
jgi:hypothetical protein